MRNTPRVNASIITGTSTQVRYIIVRAECGLAEAVRLSTAEFVRNRDYGEVAARWQEAYNILRTTLVNTDSWQVVLLNYAEMNGTFADPVFLDNHNIPALQELMYSLQVVQDDTQFHRDEALKTLDFQLRKVMSKLNPLRRDRDEVKSSWGEVRWNNNPRPKMDYAEKMRLLAVEKEALESAIMIISTLQLR